VVELVEESVGVCRGVMRRESGRESCEPASCPMIGVVVLIAREQRGGMNAGVALLDPRHSGLFIA